MGTVLDQEACRGIAEAFAAYMTSVGRLVPAGPREDPVSHRRHYWLVPGAAAVPLDGGWAFPAEGDLGDRKLSAAIAVDARGGRGDGERASLVSPVPEDLEGLPVDGLGTVPGLPPEMHLGS